jgi:hypothetical protein
MLEIINAVRRQSAVSRSRKESRLTVLESCKLWAFPYRNTAFDPILLLPVPTNSLATSMPRICLKFAQKRHER